MAEKTSLGIPENIEALLCYVLGWITGLIFILIEKENKFVRFHAFQSLITFLSFMVIMFIFMFIPLLGWIMIIFLYIGAFFFWVIGMVKAYQKEKFKFPLVGDIVEKYI